MVIAGLGLDRGPGLEPKGLTLSPGLPQVPPYLWSPFLGSRESHVPSKVGAALSVPLALRRGQWGPRAVQGLLEGGGG